MQASFHEMACLGVGTPLHRTEISLESSYFYPPWGLVDIPEL